MPDIVPLPSAPVKVLSLTSPVRALARPSLTVEPDDSLSLAAARLRENGAAIVPIVSKDRVIGVISETSLARALGQAVEPTDAVSEFAEPAETILGYETGAEALRRLEEGKTLVVVDDTRRLIGILGATSLWPRSRPPIRPVMVGGMATPLGVYLTSGNLSAGVRKSALITAGACMFSIAQASMFAATFAAEYLVKNGLQRHVAGGIQGILTVGLAGLIFRLSPLASIHAAEHQTVHAIERGLELDPVVVSRMPRVHPRCGTNYTVAFGLFLVLAQFNMGLDPDSQLVLALVVTLLFWRRLGSLVQQYVTTKPASEKHLLQSIEAGRELLDDYAHIRTSYPTVWQRIWYSGILIILTGSVLAAALVVLVAFLFHLNIGPLF